MNWISRNYIRATANFVVTWLVLAVLFWSTVNAARVSGSAGEAMTAAYREGAAAFQRGDFLAAASEFEQALAINPGDEVSTYLCAAAFALAGDEESALVYLRRLANLGSDLIPRSRTFVGLEESTAFQEVMQDIRTRARTVARSETGFVLAERDLFPEGIAYDSADSVFYLGSIYKGKIIRVQPTEDSLFISDFTDEGQDGLQGVIGMKVDAERRLLWAASAALPPWRGLTEANLGQAAVFKYDLATRQLVRRYPLDNDEAEHLLNDLVVAANGTVYISDTNTGEIFRIDPDKDKLEVFMPSGSFPGANGLALADNDSTLFVANWDSGLSLLNLVTRESVRLAHPVGVSIHGPDGIYFHEQSLIAIFNTVGPGRVMRFHLNPELTTITRAEFLECGNGLFQLPTTGTLADDTFYYIANSQIDLFGPDNQPPPFAELAEIHVLAVPLPSE